MNNKPKKAKVVIGHDAWWYDEKGGISVYVQRKNAGQSILACRIKRSDLVKFINRTEDKS